MTKDEALRLALEALKKSHPYSNTGKDLDKHSEAITAIKAALEANDEKDGSPCPEFWDWLPKAYRNGDADDLPKFTKYNMEVSFLAGKQSAALEAKDEPVAWMDASRFEELRNGFTVMTTLTKKKAFFDDVAIYTTPPQRTWVGLTDEEMEAAIPFGNLSGEYSYDDILNIILLIQAKLRSKND